MRERFRGFIDALDAAQHEVVIKRVISDFATNMGYQQYAFLQITGGEVETCTNYAAGWRQHYLGAGLSRVDPVVEKAKRSKAAFYWSVDDWDGRSFSKEIKTFGETAKHYGIRSGFTIAVQGSYGRAYMLTLARDGKKPEYPILEDQIALASAVLAIHYRLLSVAKDALICPRTVLSSQEAVCLRWSSKGLHASEIARILNVATRTVQDYLDKARAKLKASTVAHAVAIGKDQKIL